MLVFKVAAFSVIAAIIALMVKQYRPDIAIQVSIAAGLLILITVMEQVTGILSWLSDLAAEANVDIRNVNTIFKVIGISYIAQFAAQTCRDSGETSLAGKVELSAKIIMLSLALPIIKELLFVVRGLLWQG